MKTVIEMAHEAGFSLYRDISAADGSFAHLERFTELVRADERNSWPLEMEAMERQVNILTDALAEEREKWMERTAILIRGEREACAKVVEQTKWSNWFQSDAAAAIRARSNT